MSLPRPYLLDLPFSGTGLLRRVLLLLALGLLGTAGVQAQVPPPGPVTAATQAALLFNEGMKAFQAGNFQAAVDKFQEVLKVAEQGPQLEPIYFTLGAAYYNLGNYQKAVETFQTYLTKYPQSPRKNAAKLAIARANLQNKQYAEAIATYKELEDVPQYRDEAFSSQVTAHKESGAQPQAITVLERWLSSGVNNQATAIGALQLAGFYAAAKEPVKAAATLQLLRSTMNLVDNVMQLNALATQLGDGFLEENQPAEALTCYRFVLPKEQAVKFQEQQVQSLQAQIDANVAAMRADSTKAAEMVTTNTFLKARLPMAGKLVEAARNMEDFTPALNLRVARAFYMQGKKWEAIVVYDEILRHYPDAPEKEQVLFGAVVSSAEAGRADPTRKICEAYLQAYPNNANAQTVGLLLGQSSLQAGDAAAAEGYFGRMLKDQPTSQYREDMMFLMANARFSLGKFPEAEESYALYQKEFPTGTHTEEVVYRIAMSKVFAGKYEEALGLLQAYLKQYPEGAYVADAQYRIDVCKYAASLYDEVVADATEWETKFKGDSMLGEVLAIKADSLAATDKNDEAITEYIRSYKAATTDEVLNYSLFAAQKLLQKKGDWPGVSTLFEEFVAKHPEHQSVVAALYWIGKSKAREGKVEEARTFTAETLKKFIDDPKRDAVEQLLTQLAQLCLKKPPMAASAVPVIPVETAPADATAAATPAPVATPEPAPAVTYDPLAELDGLLGTGSTPVAQARIEFAHAELARLRKKNADQQAAMQNIADKFSTADLSAVLLAQVGDFLLAKGQSDKAQVLFQRMMDDYPRSDYVDYAYNGLGEIAYQKEDYTHALMYFTDAIDKAAATSKLKDVTVGKAKTLLAMKRWDDARKIFEQVASIREWRGDATAFSVYSLGEIEREQGRLPEAIAYYQRVYVAYQRYLPWVAKSYLNSAECFEKLGKKEEATKTYQEMVRQDKLTNFPEVSTARERLKTLSPG